MKKPMRWLSLAALGLSALLTGCGTNKYGFTHSLWTTHEFTHYREPAREASPAVFYAPARRDFLVTYSSLRDGDDALRRQSYFVLANADKVANYQKPVFTRTNGLGLVPVPVNGAVDVFPYAHYDTKLTIHTAERQLGPYLLPNYKESDGVTAKIALTPLAVTGDAILVGSVLGIIGWYGLGCGGYSFSVR